MGDVIDVTMMGDGEMHWLAARIALYEGIAQRMIVVEANRDHQGNERQPVLATMGLPAWVQTHVADLAGLGPWQAEGAQRDAALGLLGGLADDDVVICCDLDEFWDPARVEAIVAAVRQHGVVALGLSLRYFEPGWARSAPWTHAKAYLASRLPPSLSAVRIDLGRPAIAGAGWHLSSMGGPEAVLAKLRRYAHTEHNSPDGERRWMDLMAQMTGPSGEALTDVGVTGVPPVLLAAIAKVAAEHGRC